MGSPHTTDQCKNCGNPIVQWNNTGPWEHLSSAILDQAQSRAYQSGAKSTNLANGTLCANPRLVVEQKSVAGRTDANYRTAQRKS